MAVDIVVNSVVVVTYNLNINLIYVHFIYMRNIYRVSEFFQKKYKVCIKTLNDFYVLLDKAAIDLGRSI